MIRTGEYVDPDHFALHKAYLRGDQLKHLKFIEEIILNKAKSQMSNYSQTRNKKSLKELYGDAGSISGSNDATSVGKKTLGKRKKDKFSNPIYNHKILSVKALQSGTVIFRMKHSAYMKFISDNVNKFWTTNKIDSCFPQAFKFEKSTRKQKE